MPNYEITPTAFCKLKLHATKYPSQAVNGLLIGTVKKDKVTIQEAFPLFHGNFCLPMLEIALLQLEEYCGEQKDLCLVGYYHANELLENNDVTAVAAAIADKIQSYYEHACLILIDNKAIIKNPGIKFYVKRGSSWIVPEDKILWTVQDNAHDLLNGALKQNLQHQIVDFSHHLDDITKDWFNPHLTKKFSK
eukprot:TRINITY_DN2747_c0_g1_i1.p1 TRINITY_DN2747_c0_g1~~TRINITY_DN2747_c0_g1_i1.p1  ORF type:complete len:192 (-),score=30.52 TRINITY_DN2747_c0_g1_i1:28-603(-)